MLSPDRIKKAEYNVKGYLRDGLIKGNKKFDERILNAYIDKSNESLEVAYYLFENGISPLWITVTSYYSMYYISNAVLYKLGYKLSGEISHKVTSDALIYYVRDKLKSNLLEEFEDAQDEAFQLTEKADKIIESLEFERKKRSIFQYEMTAEVRISRAETSFQRAKIFNFELNKILID